MYVPLISKLLQDAQVLATGLLLRDKQICKAVDGDGVSSSDRRIAHDLANTDAAAPLGSRDRDQRI